MLTVHCGEDQATSDGIGHPSSYAKAKKKQTRQHFMLMAASQLASLLTEMALESGTCRSLLSSDHHLMRK